MAEEYESTDRMQLIDTVIRIRAFRGQPVGDLIAEQERLLGANTDPQMRAMIPNSSAVQAFALGRWAEARADAHRAAEINLAAAAPAMDFAARQAIWLRDAPAIRADLAALDASGINGEAIEAERTTIRAGLAAIEGSPIEALTLYREALTAWRDLGLAWDEALAGIAMATLLDPSDPEVRAAADRSREILVGLEADPFIERLDAAMARSRPDDVSALEISSPTEAAASWPS